MCVSCQLCREGRIGPLLVDIVLPRRDWTSGNQEVSCFVHMCSTNSYHVCIYRAVFYQISVQRVCCMLLLHTIFHALLYSSSTQHTINSLSSNAHTDQRTLQRQCHVLYRLSPVQTSTMTAGSTNRRKARKQELHIYIQYINVNMYTCPHALYLATSLLFT